MGDDERTPERAGELSWAERVLRLSNALTEQDIPFAFGGAIAVNYHREPRATLDIDVNIFLAPSEHDAIIETLVDMGADEEAIATFRRDLLDAGQARVPVGDTIIDFFMADLEFHDSMAARIEQQTFLDASIPVLSIEDLMVCKILFNRAKDWVDIEAVLATEGDDLDRPYIQHWLGEFLPDDDSRISRFASLVDGIAGA